MSADDGIHGEELWSVDLTTGNASLLLDLTAGADPTTCEEMTSIGGKVVYAARHPTWDFEVLVYDPADNTVSLACGERFTSSAYLFAFEVYFAELAGKLYFTMRDDSAGYSLWEYDPSDGSCSMALDPGTSNGPSNTIVLGDKLFFGADGDNSAAHPNDALYSFQPSTSTFTLISDSYPGLNGAEVGESIVLGGELFYSDKTSAEGYELWKYDPNTATAAMVEDIRPGSGGSSPSAFAAVDGVVTFAASADDTIGYELYQYDPGTGAVSLVADLAAGSSHGNPRYPFVDGNTVYYSIVDNDSGRELWSYTPSTGDIHRVTDVMAGPASSYPVVLGMGSRDGTLVVLLNDVDHYRELFEVDVATGEATIIADVNAIGDGSNPSALVPCGDFLYFQATNRLNKTQLWRYSMQSREADMVSIVAVGSSLSVQYMTEHAGRLYFAATTSSTAGQEPHTLNCASQEWKMLADLYSGTASSSPMYFTGIGDVVYFRARSVSNGYEIYTYNVGTEAVGVIDIQSGSSHSYPAYLVALDGKLYFNARYSWDEDIELLSYDPQTESVTKLTDINTGGSSTPSYMVASGTKLFFQANDGSTGTELWSYDTVGGATEQVVDLRPGTSGSAIKDMVVSGDLIFGSATDGVNGYEPWVCNTSASPVDCHMLRDVYPGSSSSQPKAYLAVPGGMLVAIADSNQGTGGLFMYSTANGTFSEVDSVEELGGSAGSLRTFSDGRFLAFLGKHASENVGTELSFMLTSDLP